MYFVRLGLVKRLQIRALVGSLFLGIDSSGGIDFSGRQFRMADTDTKSLYEHNNENWIWSWFSYLSAQVYTKTYCQWQNFVLFRWCGVSMIFASNEYQHIFDSKPFKGIMASDEYFWAYKIKSVLSVWSQMVFNFFASYLPSFCLLLWKHVH